MATIDVHSHIIPTSVVEAITNNPAVFSARVEDEDNSKHVVHEQGFSYPLFDEFVDPEAKVRAMDRKGLDVSVLSPPPTFFYYGADAVQGANIARLINDGIAEFVSTNSERFRGMATVPMQEPDAAIAELERVVSTYGFQAVEVGTSVEDTQLADKRYRPFLERVAELNVLVLTHPYYVGAMRGLEDYYLTNLIGNPYDSTLMVANLMFGGTLDELPNLKLCVVHAGGFAPYQIGRFEHGYQVRPESRAKARTSPLHLMHRLYFDTITFNPKALRYLIDLVGEDNIVLGSDAPFDMADEAPLTSLESVPYLTNKEREAILSKTARKLLNEEAS
ncbi:MAG TPA: amidohydrolase family protein [Rubrobacteraceae bacterium]|jgi:aminocarboxymuconate-semialdehyde decarboxylase|nr:amidohydrolase family protein [Rubrobacteraceae bacterium]